MLYRLQRRENPLVEDTRLELVEACLQSRCSSRCANPPNKMFLQLTVKNQEHQKIQTSRCVAYFFEKEIEETIIQIDIFYCLLAVTHLSKETSNCQRTFILYNSKCIYKLFYLLFSFLSVLRNETFNIFLTLLYKIRF